MGSQGNGFDLGWSAWAGLGVGVIVAVATEWLCRARSEEGQPSPTLLPEEQEKFRPTDLQADEPGFQERLQ
jgi:hypothetical protein